MKTNSHQSPSSFILHPSSFIILLAFSAFALMPLTAPGYFIQAHDARHSVYFLQMFDMSMRDGAWFPRWAADMVFGYGYPLWLILAPLPFFVGEAFHLVGFDLVSAVKIVDGLAVFFSAITMYLFAARALGNKNAALVAAVAYVYVPYHLADLYVRGAQAELIAFVFPPLIFWAFHRLASEPNGRNLAFAALSYAGILLSHVQTTVFVTPIVGAYLLFLLIRTRHSLVAIRYSLFASLAIALALGLAAIFMLPILFEQKYLTSDPLIGGFFNYRKHFLNVSQLFSPFWGYGYAGENGNDQFSLQLGLIPVLLTLVALWRIRHTDIAHTAFFAIVLLVLVFAMLPISAPVWEPFAAIVAFAQFPWRLLIIVACPLAFLSGAAFLALDESRALVSALALCLLFVIANFSYTLPQHTEAVFNYQTQMAFEVKDRELLGDTIWVSNRPQDSPLVAQYLAGEKLTRALALDDNANVETLRYGGQSVEARVDAHAPADVLFYTRYFPGWVATLDGQPLAIEPYGEQGLIRARVPTGSHVVKIRFEDTLVRQVGALISGISLLIALALINFVKS
ncbi:MAG: hypothetical protein HY868_01260 [Chloroflexi bacterium]|nr:hypothetical protein [Chloroflexota bacterium]